MTKKNNCPEGSRWCPIQKKCIPEDKVKGQGHRKGRGQTQGPMGVPVKKFKEAVKLIDEIFDEGLDHYGKLKEAEIELNKILEVCGRVHKEQEDEDEIDLGKGTMNTTGRPYDHPIKMRVRELSEEDKSAYKVFFDKMLKKFGVNSPAELSDEKKKEFFNQVDVGWKGRDEDEGVNQ